MNKQDVIIRLRENEVALRKQGVDHIALFGSLARGTATVKSDLDILLELDPERQISVDDYVRLKNHVAALFGSRVDVVSRESLKPYLRLSVEAEAIYAF
jgi:uncharacterized protein